MHTEETMPQSNCCMDTPRVPSKFQISQRVRVDFGDGQVIRYAHVNAVKFTERGKVIYDIRVALPGGIDTFIDNVDSVFVREYIS